MPAKAETVGVLPGKEGRRTYFSEHSAECEWYWVTVVIVESGWGSILPTVIIANMMHGGPAEKSGKLNIGDQIMSINGTSLVGLPLSTCQADFIH